MDKLDRKILAELQKDGRLSVTDLGKRVGLSLSPCHRRVRALEDAGVITGYRASIAPEAVGLNFSAIVFASLRESSRDNVRAFEDALVDIPEIVQAQRLFGEPDYMLHIVTQDITTFQKLYDSTLSALPSVLKLKSTLVMRDIIHNRPLAL
ncbi:MULTISPECIES: Lrp/AsnC family transcriptional regulator [Yersinia]|uniref:Lrp/AsnC family transcriptional regulator n=1 Tax=Yersinia TaxID=629 RepID=UPI0005E85F7D|nr:MULTISPECIES: Lrp/AsnC family transcriptional regulator [Yersinia]OVZ96232.1 AsnC family transcriptional regulator [Yersinia frederiksenii]RXA98049.1 Lrp/AsnC family transcriptional regulator [Yersinia sp. 2105 StPb PI]CNH97799.1 leucine-responsive transcriptional regulator [Yersinia frederiksenii]CNI04645.1 leucine-responsive transcriptional regulator [Yersinia frederiksenii]CNK09842.1 leucine-responsive transcriptional regulator [Yersinia frederiksenii]